jgi:hypothetical protein
MKSRYLLLVAPFLARPVLASAQQGGQMPGMQMQMGGQQDSQPAQTGGLTAADIAGTWVGSETDTAFVPTAGQEKSDTLVLKADSSYAWTRTVSGKSQKMMVNQQAPTDNKYKRLTSTNISWWGGPGYTIKLDGDKLTLVQVQANPQTKKKAHLAFTGVSK